jgi:hypothetical protein
MDGYFLAMFQIAFGTGVGFNVDWSAKRRKMRSKMGVIATNIPKPGVIAKIGGKGEQQKFAFS